MKNIFLTSALLFSITSHAQDMQLQSLSKCINGINGEQRGNDGPYSTVLSSGTDGKNGSLLVLSGQGAKIVNGTYGGESRGLMFTFTPAGQKEVIRQQSYFRDGKIDMGWTSHGVKDSPSESKNVSANDAVKFAGSGLLARANQKSGDIQKELNSFDEWVRSRYVSQQNGFSTERNPNRAVNEERLESKRRTIEKSLDDLKSCDQVANADVKKAAQLERARLAQIKDRVDSLGKESKAIQDCVKEKTGSSGSGQPQEPTKAVR